jgi:hypothetical protein
MAPQELLLHVFCLIDDELQALGLGRLRRRGPATKLADSEVITIELVGEFWKLHTDRDLYRHFRRYLTAESPALARLHRTTFARQAANRWSRWRTGSSPASPESWPGDGPLTGGVPKKSRTCGPAGGILSGCLSQRDQDLLAHQVRRTGRPKLPGPRSGPGGGRPAAGLAPEVPRR